MKPTHKIFYMSIAAIVAGVLGLALFGIPYAGLALGLIGAAIGFYSLALASARRNAPMALALAGSGLSVVAAGVSAFSVYRGLQPTDAPASAAAVATDSTGESTAANSDSDAVTPSDLSRFAAAGVKSAIAGEIADARNPLNLAMGAIRRAAATSGPPNNRLASTALGAAATPAPGPITLRLQSSGDAGQRATVDSSVHADSAATSTAPPKPEDGGASQPAQKAPIHWAAAERGEAQGNGDIQVTIDKVTDGVLYYRLGDNALLDGNQTTFPLLHIWVKVQNNQTAGVVDYSGWNSLPPADATLTDASGNEVKRFDIGKIAQPGQKVAILDSHPTAKIGISESNVDVILFYMPPEGAQTLRLKLSGKPVGLSDDLYFEIPRSMIKASEVNPLLPLGSQ